MTTPGDDVIGKLSVRVRPDTDGLRSEVKRELDAIEQSLKLTIPVDFKVDPEELRRDLAAIHARIEVPVSFDVDVGLLRAQLQAIDNTSITVTANIDLDTAAFQAQLAALANAAIDIRVNVSGVALAIAELTALEQLVDRLDGRTINIQVDVDAAGAIAQLAAIETALLALRGSIGSIGTPGGGSRGFGGMNSMLLGIVGSLVQATALSAALAVAGAAVTAAWATVSTAIAALPAALFLAAGPIAAIAIGFDGIKEAAKTLKPEFDKLQAAVENSLQRSFTTAFNTIRPIFPALQLGLVAVADGVGTVVNQLAAMTVAATDSGLLARIFDNVRVSLQGMAPGIRDIGEALLEVAGRGAAFDALTEAVNRFGAAFESSVSQLITSGEMDAAFRGLGDLLGELGEAFVSLVDNGIQTFVSAAPGVTSFLNDLTGFFDRFDWAALGAAVGGVFEGLGSALSNVPQGVIDEIATSFGELGKVFSDSTFQADLQTMIAGIPTAVREIGAFTTAFADIGAKVSLGLQGLETAGGKFQTFIDDAMRFADTLSTHVPDNIKTALNDIDTQFDTWFEELTGISAAEWDGVGDANQQGAKDALAKIPPEVATGLIPIVGAVTSGLAPVAPAAGTELGKVPPAAAEALSPLEQAFTTAFAGLPAVVQQGFAGLSVPAIAGMAGIAIGVQDGMIAVSGAFRTGIEGLGPVLTTAFGTVTAAATTGMSLLTTTFSTSAAQLGPLFTTALLPLSTAMTTAMQGLALAATTGMTSVSAAIGAGFTLVTTNVAAHMITLQSSFSTPWPSIASSVTTGMGLVSSAVAVGFPLMVVAVNAGMLTVQQALSTAFATISTTTIPLAMQTLATAVTTGFVLIQESFRLGFTTIGTIITDAFAVTLVVAVQTGMIALNAAFVQGFVTIVESVRVGFANIQTAFTEGWASVNLSTTTAMTEAQTAVETGMTNMTTAVTNGMTEIKTAVETGMRDMVTSVEQGVADAVAAAESAVPQFRAAGENMGQALADGLRSKIGEVQAAAQALADAAAAATAAAAQINSPSRVFTKLGDMMGLGLLNGLDDSEAAIIQSAKRITDALTNQFGQVDTSAAVNGLDEFKRMNNRLVFSTDAVNTALGGDRGEAKVFNFYETYNNPIAEPASATRARHARTKAAMGMFD